MAKSKSLGTVVGLRGKRGYPTTKIAKTTKQNGFSKRGRFVRDLIDEIAGYSPYEARAVDLLEINEKKAQKFIRSRIGNLKKAKAKVRKLEEVKRKLKKREQEIKEEEAKKKSQTQ